MKTKYLLKRKRNVPKGGTHPIYIALYEGGDQQIIFTGQRCTVAEWGDGKPKDEQCELTREIERVKALVNKAKIRLEADDLAISPFTVKQAYEALSKAKIATQATKDKVAKEGLKSVYSLAGKYKEDLPDKYSQATRRTLKISIDQFMLFLDKHGFRSLEIKDLTDQVLEDYSKYLLKKRNLNNSTHNKRMKHLNWFLRTTNFRMVFKPRKVVKNQIVALTVKELRALEATNVKSIDLKSHKEISQEFLQRAKDMFLLGCYTALRISDLKRINLSNSSNGFINLTTKKNNEVYRMPIMHEAQTILDRYEGRSPRISEQEVNRSIKIVCEAAKINQKIEWNEMRGDLTVTKSFPKYQKITSHIGAKTFITNAKELWGLEPSEVAAIVRKDLKTMLNHYFKLPVESAITKMIAVKERAKMKAAI